MKRIEYKSLFIRSYAVAVVVLFAGVHSPMLFMLQWYDRMVSGALDAGYLSQNTGEYLAANKELIFSNFIVQNTSFHCCVSHCSVPALQNNLSLPFSSSSQVDQQRNCFDGVIFIRDLVPACFSVETVRLW